MNITIIQAYIILVFTADWWLLPTVIDDDGHEAIL